VKTKKSEAIGFKIKPEETVELSFDVKSRNQRYFCTVQILKKKRARFSATSATNREATGSRLAHTRRQSRSGHGRLGGGMRRGGVLRRGRRREGGSGGGRSAHLRRPGDLAGGTDRAIWWTRERCFG
jgi:hypothetical protein